MNFKARTYCAKKAIELYESEKKADAIFDDEGYMYENVPLNFFQKGFECALEYAGIAHHIDEEDVNSILNIYEELLDCGKDIDRTDALKEHNDCCIKTAEIFNKII